MTDSSKGDSPSPRRQFSLAQLMLCVVIVGVFLGAMRLILPRSPYDFFPPYVLIIGVMASVIVLLAAAGKVRLVPMLAVLAALGVVIGYWLQPTSSTRRRPPCNDNLKQIAAALASYHDLHGSLPPAFVSDSQGKPMHSWRVLILPYLGEQALYDKYRFDEPWDGPNNRKLHQRIVAAYHCPGSRDDPTPANDTDASYAVVVGPHTAFPDENSISLADILDGTSNTILVVEVAGSGIHWMEPRDLHVTQMARQINPPRGQGISSPHPPGGANVVMVDGTVKFLDAKSLTADQLEGLLTIAGGEQVKTQ